MIGQKNSNDFSSHYYYIIYLLIVGSPFFGEDQNSKKSKGDWHFYDKCLEQNATFKWNKLITLCCTNSVGPIRIIF